MFSIHSSHRRAPFIALVSCSTALLAQRQPGRPIGKVTTIGNLIGKKPTAELLTAANNIAQHWIAYWAKTTGGRSSMTVTPLR